MTITVSTSSITENVGDSADVTLTLPSSADGLHTVTVFPLSTHSNVISFGIVSGGSITGSFLGGIVITPTNGETEVVYSVQGVSVNTDSVVTTNTFGYANPDNITVTITAAPTPIVTQIEASLITTLSAVTVANGYQINLVVERAITDGNIIADLKAVVSRGELREVTDNDRDRPGREVPLMHDGYFQTFDIAVTRAQSTLDLDASTAIADADIRKAIKANSTLGGMVQNIFWQPTKPVFVGQIPGIVISFEAFFFTTIDDPYSQ